MVHSAVMSKFWKTQDESKDENTNRPQSDMLIAREKALKATIKANKILSKYSSAQKELEKMERKTQWLFRWATPLRFTLTGLVITTVGLTLFYLNFH